MTKRLASTLHIQKQTHHFRPRVGIILGSGLGGLVHRLEAAYILNYQDIPDFPATHVKGHQHLLHLGLLAGVPVVCLQGRSHFYEGIANKTIITQVRTLQELGCEILLITNAAGSLHADILPGSIIIIKDHINLQFNNVLVGYLQNDEDFAFISMENAYCPELRQKLIATAQQLEMPLREGIYMGTLGPTFETPAEVRAFAQLGADVVGMSSIAEVMVARHCNMRVAALSVVTNLGAGLGSIELSHELTLKNAAQVGAKLERLVYQFIKCFYSS